MNQLFSNRSHVDNLAQLGVLDGRPNLEQGKVDWATGERFGGHVDYHAVDSAVSKMVRKCNANKVEGCVIDLEHGWRITLRRAEVWAAQGYIDAALPGRVRERLHDSFCRKMSDRAQEDVEVGVE